jgi:hypothetical protein
MSDSSNSGKFARDTARAAPSAPSAPEEWQATRAEPATQDEVDEWQATRVQPRQPSEEAWPGAHPGPQPMASVPVRTATPPAERRVGRFGVAAESPDAWAATRAQTALATQLLDNESDYLAAEKDEIGRQIGNNERELFVSCAPAEALQQQFEHLQPNFIAVHDVGTSSSRKLLTGIAAASGRAVQRLVVRRQGYGTALATLEFVELPTADNQMLRLYTTESDADTASRHAIARVLLAYSRLGVVMVGELPGHAIASALKPLRDDIIAGPWPNRNLLLLPLASASTLVTHGLDLGRGTGVAVRTTPQVARPADAWAFITGTWSRLREQTPADGRAVPELGAFKPAAYEPRRPPLATGLPSGDTLPMEDGHRPVVLTMRPMPAIATAASGPVVPATLIDRYVKQVSDLNGVISCCVFDVQSGRPIAHAGANPAAGELATHGGTLMAAMTAASRGLGLGHAVPEAAITLGGHHLILRGVPRNPGLAVHAVLDKASANLTLARLQLLRMDAMFDEAQHA